MNNIFRPNNLDKVIGQTDVIKQLKISIDSANKRHAALGHVLLYGPAGLGKTTISNAIANELRVPIQTLNAASVGSHRDLLAYLMNIEYRSVLFIDEIHRLNKRTEEFLYPILEDFVLTLSTPGKDFEVGETIKMSLPEFTVVGATTTPGNLSPPFRDRFKNKQSLTPYSPSDLLSIIDINSEKLNVSLTCGAKNILSNVSRGVPRITNSLLELTRDYLLHKNKTLGEEHDIYQCLDLVGIDDYGVNKDERKYLSFIEKFSKPIGIETICLGLNLDKETVSHTIEPYLIQLGYIYRSPKGRILTKSGKNYLKERYNANQIE